MNSPTCANLRSLLYSALAAVHLSNITPYPVCSGNNELCPSRSVFPRRPIFQNTILIEQDKELCQAFNYQAQSPLYEPSLGSSACPQHTKTKRFCQNGCCPLRLYRLPEISLLYDSSISNRAQVTVGKNQYFSLMKNKNKIKPSPIFFPTAVPHIDIELCF